MTTWTRSALLLAIALAGCMDTEIDEGWDETAELDEALRIDARPPRLPPAIPWDEMTALQRHVAFFDWNGDAYITVAEDYHGLRALGIPPVLAASFATSINAVLATPSRGFPSLTIDLRRIETGIHGSDSGIYDSHGRFVPEQFERLFDDWDRNGSDGLDPLELTARSIVDSDLWDVFGAAISAAEFGLLWVVAQEDGELSRDRMRAFYDGTLFYVLAAQRAPT